jgi:hypothetical protein
MENNNLLENKTYKDIGRSTSIFMYTVNFFNEETTAPQKLKVKIIKHMPYF